ncbi:MAG: DctP family TRAP transporter solute-binding subunit [Planctomycetota bacterium]|jgi:tripartite ATP-independent transporter DctP family solute receptor|nr:DctP family TRAP transporter solute-binding subunit [Planctomycetota bacterium]
MKNQAWIWLLAASIAAEAAFGGQVEMSVVAGSMTANSPAGIAVTELAKKITGHSNGSIRANPFYEAQLGDARSMVQGLQQGTVDIGVAGNAYFSSFVPEIQVFELPFLFSGYPAARGVLDSPAVEPVKSLLESKGIKCLSFWEIGFRHLTNNVRPVKSMADVKGLKLRTLPANIQVKTWENFGANPIAIDSSELYSALQTGVVVGQENSISEIYTKKLQEVQKYLSLTGHVYTPMTLGMSIRTWNKLDAAQREAVLKAAGDATALVRRLGDEHERDGLENLRASSLEIVDNPDLGDFRETAKKSYDLFVEGNPNRKALLESIQAAARNFP